MSHTSSKQAKYLAYLASLVRFEHRNVMRRLTSMLDAATYAGDIAERVQQELTSKEWKAWLRLTKVNNETALQYIEIAKRGQELKKTVKKLKTTLFLIARDLHVIDRRSAGSRRRRS